MSLDTVMRSQARPRRFAPLLCLTIASLAIGCRNAPVNPFLAQHPENCNCGAHGDEASEEETPEIAKSGEELADDLTATARSSADAVRLAALRTLGTAKDEARQVGAQTVANVNQLAHDANQSAQLRAVQSVAEWPLEQAGPVLLVVIAEGSAAARQAAAAQLAKRWPPAAEFPVEGAAEDRTVALAALGELWNQQYGELHQAVVETQAQAKQVADNVEQLVEDTRAVADAAAGAARSRVEEVNQMLDAIRQADLPEAARNQARQTLASLAQDADLAVRRRAAEAMGEVADPAYLPILVSLLSDQPEVQVVAVVSLERVAGDQAPKAALSPSASQDEKVRQWQLWYREQQNRQPQATVSG